MQCCRCRMCLHVLCTLHMFTICVGHGTDPQIGVRTIDSFRVNICKRIGKWNGKRFVTGLQDHWSLIARMHCNQVVTSLCIA